MLKYDSYKDSGEEYIGEIPNHWNVSKFKFQGDVIIGLSYKPDNQVNEGEGVLVMRSSNVQNGKPTFEDNVYVDCEIPEKLRTKEGDILICSRNGSRRLIGKNCFITKEIEGMSWGVFMTVYRSKSPKYFYWLLNSPVFESQSSMFLTSTINQLTVSTLNNLIVPFTKNETEQNQIVKYLDTKTTQIDTLIETTKKKIELLKENRTTLINHVVTKGLNPDVETKDSGVEWIGKIPKHWEILRINNIGEFSKGRGITKEKIKKTGNPCIRNGEIYTTYDRITYEIKSFINDDDSKDSIIVDKGTVLFTGDGETLEEIGKTLVYNGNSPLWVGGGINILKPNTQKVNPIFLSYTLNSEYVVYQKSRQGKGQIVVHIYSKQLRDVQVVIPPLTEQLQIVDYLDLQTQTIDTTIDNEQKRIELLTEYRKTLISDVVTGKVKVTTDE